MIVPLAILLEDALDEKVSFEVVDSPIGGVLARPGRKRKDLHLMQTLSEAAMPKKKLIPHGLAAEVLGGRLRLGHEGLLP